MCAEPSRSTTVSNLRLKKAKHYGQNFPKSFRPFSAGTEEPFTIQSHKLHGRTFIVTVVMVTTCLLYLLARIGSIFPNVNGCTHVTCMSHVQIHTHTHTHTHTPQWLYHTHWPWCPSPPHPLQGGLYFQSRQVLFTTSKVLPLLIFLKGGHRGGERGRRGRGEGEGRIEGKCR